MTQFTYQERFKTEQGVFDEFTNRSLFELQSKKIFDDLISPLKVGKESNVFVAMKGRKKVIVKIYRVQNCDFTKMYHYIGQDPRYEFLKKHRRQIIIAWTQREYKNLQRAHKVGVKCPKPLAIFNHVLVEEMIGDPALPLKDDKPTNPSLFFEMVLEEMQKLYWAGIVHGDLSAFNILNLNQRPVLIDFSQSTLLKAPNAQELLERDVDNILQFFGKFKIYRTKEEILREICDH